MGYTFTASDIPGRIDVLLDNQGYLLADQVSSPVASAYGLQRATFGNSPVFVSRQNTQGNYGDNQQDAWLTASQNDWSLGEQQKYFRGNDADRLRKYWTGRDIDISTPGEVSIRPGQTAFNPLVTIKSGCSASSGSVAFSTATKLYHMDYAGAFTDNGVHGLGATPSRFGMVGDANNRYLSTTSGGTVGVRRWSGAAFSTYSATGADSIAWLNNALYGYSNATSTLYRYAPGAEPVTASSLFVWQDGLSGGVGVNGKILAFGGKLLILRYRTSGPRGAELYIYDGNAPTKVAEFPANFLAYDMEFIDSTVFVSGCFEKHSGANIQQKSAIFFYKDGSQGILWKSDQYGAIGSFTTIAPPLAIYDGGLVFFDKGGTDVNSGGYTNFYNPDTGAFSTISSGQMTGDALVISAGSFFAVWPDTTSSSPGFLFPDASNNAGSALLWTSLIDLDTSLTKLIRGARADFSVTGTGSVDLSYRFNDLDSPTYTSLATGITSGTEVLFPAAVEGTTYRSISFLVTLQRGATTTSNVKLKRLSIRAMPILPVYKRRTYTFMLGGRDGKSPLMLRDQTPHSLDGKDMATNLQTAASRTAPFSITDHLGTFVGRIEEDGLKMIEYKPEQWVAHVSVRET